MFQENHLGVVIVIPVIQQKKPGSERLPKVIQPVSWQGQIQTQISLIPEVTLTPPRKVKFPGEAALSREQGCLRLLVKTHGDRQHSTHGVLTHAHPQD